MFAEVCNRTPSSARLSASGSARPATRPLRAAPGPSPPLLLLPSGGASQSFRSSTCLTVLLQYRPSVARADRGISYFVGSFRHALFSHSFLSSSYACKTTTLWHARTMLSQNKMRTCASSHWPKLSLVKRKLFWSLTPATSDPLPPPMGVQLRDLAVSCLDIMELPGLLMCHRYYLGLK